MSSIRRIAVVVLAITLTAPALAAHEPAHETQRPAAALTFERVFANPSLSGPVPRKVKLSPDGRWITVLKNRPEDRERYDLWGYDRQGGQWTLLVDSTKIRDPLLIIHGLADDNVVFEHSSAIIARLQGEAVPFEMMLYPGFTHRISGPQVSRHLYETIFRFLERQGVTPP